MPQSAHNKNNFWREEHIALQEPDSHLKKVKKLGVAHSPSKYGVIVTWGLCSWFNQGHNKDPKTFFFFNMFIDNHIK